MISFVLSSTNGLLLKEADAVAVNGNTDHTVKICHATPPDTAVEGYQSSTIDKNAVFTQGHSEHSADIIPDFNYKKCPEGYNYNPGLNICKSGSDDIVPEDESYPGQNWDSDGQEIWNNDCEVVFDNGDSDVTIVAHKVICEDESDLPNMSGDPNIDENTAENWVLNSEGKCWLTGDWGFQWKAGEIQGSDADDNVGELSDWETFSIGAPVVISGLENGTTISAREVMKDGYIPFSGEKTTGNSYSAEFYCANDVMNYDNLEWIQNIELGKTYYCAAFNAPKTTDVEICKINDEEEKLPGWEVILTYKNTDLEFIGTTEDNEGEDSHGCINFTNVPYGEYVLSETLQDGWINVSGLGDVVIDDENNEFIIENKEREEVTIIAQKIVCEDETYLPNWGAVESDGNPITSTTAQTFLDDVNDQAGREVCRLESGWNFQWANSSAINPGDDIEDGGLDWNTFGPTDSNGQAITTVDDLTGIGDHFWMREMLKPGYILFSGTMKNPHDDVSAEFYCHVDVLNYDNYDRIDNPQLGETYYCVGFNALEEEMPVCGNDVKDEGEDCDGEDGVLYGQVCTDECKLDCDPNVNLILNGDFENPIVDNTDKWDIFSDGTLGLEWIVQWMSSFLDAPQTANLELHKGVNNRSPYLGEQYAELDTDWDGPGGSIHEEEASVSISQILNTVPGRTYTVSFAFSPRPGKGEAENILGVRWDGSIIDTKSRSGIGKSDTDWSKHDYEVVASSYLSHVHFEDHGTPNSEGTFLDDVQVYCKIESEPEPIRYLCNQDTWKCVEDSEGQYDEADCQAICVAPEPSICGNETLDPGEECDGTAGLAGDGSNFCTNTCKLIPLYNGDHECPEGTYPEETPIESIDISSENTVGEILNLVAGSYLFKASGQYQYSNNDDHKADAGYGTKDNWSTLRDDLGITEGVLYRGVLSLLSDMGTGVMGVVNWGEYDEENTDHVYYKAHTFDEDKEVSFVISDWYDEWYDSYQNQGAMHDNLGELKLDVYQCVENNNGNEEDSLPSLVTIESPKGGDTVSGIVDIYGTVVEETELSHYNISIYGGDADFNSSGLRLEQKTEYLSDEFDNELIYQWDTTGYADGEYLIRLAARDKAGNRDLSGDPWLGGDDSQHVIKVIVKNENNNEGDNEENGGDNGASTTTTTTIASSGPTGSHISGQFASSGGIVLGESVVRGEEGIVAGASCVPYLYEYIKYGADNNPFEVKKLQAFLNGYLGLNLDVSGIYDQETYEAVKRFQGMLKYDILSPWVDNGCLPSENIATGYVYRTTKWAINNMFCPSPKPDISDEKCYLGDYIGLADNLNGQVLGESLALGEEEVLPKENLLNSTENEESLDNSEEGLITEGMEENEDPLAQGVIVALLTVLALGGLAYIVFRGKMA